MSNESVLQYSLESIKDHLVAEGAEKQIFKIVEDDVPYAMKIFKSRKPGNNNVDRDTEARKEFEAYKFLRNTPLKKLIPAPIRLVETKLGKAIGLVTEWRDGITLENAGVVLNNNQIADLRQMFIGIYSSGVKVDIDMCSEQNIMVDGQSLWFAECKTFPLTGSSDELELYGSAINSQIEFLRRNYTMIS